LIHINWFYRNYRYDRHVKKLFRYFFEVKLKPASMHRKSLSLLIRVNSLKTRFVQQQCKSFLCALFLNKPLRAMKALYGIGYR